jgi:hypothetical protein
MQGDKHSTNNFQHNQRGKVKTFYPTGMQFNNINLPIISLFLNRVPALGLSTNRHISNIRKQGGHFSFTGTNDLWGFEKSDFWFRTFYFDF